ncbi:MAG: alpha/beta fold hydrolase [Opitutaceae bacterium]|jgi:pimeloyl-ACP methyl ester carboxylesterase
MLFHRDFGAPGLPPLVILHGLLGSSRNWQVTGRDLASRFHVFALDLRNHGASPHDNAAGFEAMMADVVEWLDRQELSRVTLMGHSLGGKVAMLLACRHPERVERLVVVDMAPKDSVSIAHRAEFAAMCELRLDSLGSRAEAELHLESRVPDWAKRKFLLTNLECDEQGRWRWLVNLPALAGSLPELEMNPLAPGDRFTGSALFIVGGKSNYVDAGDFPAIGAHFPAARVEVLPDSGHNPHMDDRDAFVRLVTSECL